VLQSRLSAFAHIEHALEKNAASDCKAIEIVGAPEGTRNPRFRRKSHIMASFYIHAHTHNHHKYHKYRSLSFVAVGASLRRSDRPLTTPKYGKSNGNAVRGAITSFKSRKGATTNISNHTLNGGPDAVSLRRFAGRRLFGDRKPVPEVLRVQQLGYHLLREFFPCIMHAVPTG